MNPGREGWALRDRLAWLLLDVGNDFCISKTQAQVANDFDGSHVLHLDECWQVASH